MKVKLLSAFCGTPSGQIGDVIDVDEKTGQRMVDKGLAQRVDGGEDVETATAKRSRSK